MYLWKGATREDAYPLELLVSITTKDPAFDWSSLIHLPHLSKGMKYKMLCIYSYTLAYDVYFYLASSTTELEAFMELNAYNAVYFFNLFHLQIN